MEDPAQVGARHDDAAVGEVHDAQHAVDEAEAVRHRGVEPREQHRRDGQVDEAGHGHFAQRGFAATPGALATSFG